MTGSNGMTLSRPQTCSWPMRCTFWLVLWAGAVVPQAGRYQYYVPGPDNALQMEAAYGLVRGHGYAVRSRSWKQLFERQVEYWRVTEFPPGISLLLAPLLLLGLTAEAGMMIVEVSALALGSYGWLAVGQRLFSRKTALVAYVVLVALNGTPTRIGNSVSDSVLWAISPFWMLAWWGTPRRQGYPLWAGLLSAAAILARYQAVSLIAADLLVATVGCRTRRLRRVCLGTVPAIIALAAIFGTNYVQSGTTNSLERQVGMRTVHWHRLATTVPAEQVFLRPTGFAWMRDKLLRSLPDTASIWVRWAGTVMGVLSVVAGAAAALALWTSHKHTVAWPAAAAFGTVVLLLGGLAISHQGALPVGWTFLDDQRYYLWLVPLGAAAAVTLGTALGRSERRWIRVAVCAVGLLAVGYSTASWTRYSLGMWGERGLRQEFHELLADLDMLRGRTEAERLAVISPQAWYLRVAGIEAYWPLSSEEVEEFLADYPKLRSKVASGEMRLLVIGASKDDENLGDAATQRLVQSLQLRRVRSYPVSGMVIFGPENMLL